ncbi:hypothetical protein BD779DRAFT_1784893 [Infundibulicybe gibba]|nr:hypothetical protein BD779DRAFT_1784893 [Infundibulicybe gibba]
MDRETYLPYSDPEKFTASLALSDQGKELPRPCQNPAFWRGKKRIFITVTIVLAAFVAGIVIGVVVSTTRKHDPGQPPLPASSFSVESASPSTSAPAPISSFQPIPSPQPVPTTLATAFKSSSWIWQGAQALIGVPSGDWAFRKTLPTSTAPAKEAIALLTVDDAFQLYHNGQLIAENSTLGWQMATAVHINLDPNFNVFAIQAHNSPLSADPNENTPAGLLASIQISYADGSTTTISSDDTWRVIQPIPDEFESTSFDDTLWQSAAAMATYGSGPWGNIAIPTQVYNPPAR